MTHRLVELLRRAQQAVDATYAIEDRSAVTMEQICLLRTLYRYGPQNQADLGRACSIDRSTVSGMIARLNRAGLLAAVRNEQVDRRAKMVTITPRGRSALLDADQAARIAEEHVLGRVGVRERPELFRMLRLLAGVAP